MKQKQSILLIVALAIWLAIVGAGIGLLQTYSFAAGVTGTPDAQWPAASRIAMSRADFALMMVVHPHCPCSRASIGELSILMARARGKMSATVVFVAPPGFSDLWTKSDLWSSAKKIPGVSCIIDHGTEAKLFGAATSGQTMVYDRRGRLVFSGGITVARGHFGDNAGVTAIAGLIDPVESSTGLRPIADTRAPAVIEARNEVYGCPLFASSSTTRRELSKCRK